MPVQVPVNQVGRDVVIEAENSLPVQAANLPSETRRLINGFYCEYF